MGSCLICIRPESWPGEKKRPSGYTAEKEPQWGVKSRTMPQVRVGVRKGYLIRQPPEGIVPSEGTTVIKEAPVLHRSMFFLGSGRAIPVIPWRICYAPKNILVRGFHLWFNPRPPSVIMRDCIPVGFKSPHARPGSHMLMSPPDTFGCVHKFLSFPFLRPRCRVVVAPCIF